MSRCVMCILPLNIIQDFHAVIVEILDGISLQVQNPEIGESGEMLNLQHVVDEVVLQVDCVQ